jgi:hypothetical protein
MEWTITTSSSTKIMGLAGYEFAKQKGIPCVQVDVLREKVISLVQKIEVDEQRFFHLTIDEYVKNYGVQPLSVVDNSDFSPNGLTACETHLPLPSRKELRPHPNSNNEDRYGPSCVRIPAPCLPPPLAGEARAA